jgi:hypothetical protein
MLNQPISAGVLAGGSMVIAAVYIGAVSGTQGRPMTPKS